MATLQRSQSSVHFDGLIHFKTSRDGNYSRLFAQLKGKDLLVYTATDKRTFNNKMQPQQTISLHGVISVKKDMTGRAIKQNSPFPTISVTFSKECELQYFRLRGNNLIEQDEWYRYLYVVCLEELPVDLSSLLPGQIQKLTDILETIKYDDVSYLDMKPAPLTPSPRTPISAGLVQSSGTFSFNRKTSLPSPVAPSSATMFNIGNRVPSHPHGNAINTFTHSASNKSWFINGSVGRDEAENILHCNKEHGNMLLRRRSTIDDQDPWNYAVSIKSNEIGEKQYKHYKVKEVQEGSRVHYVINLAAEDNHERLNTFQDIVDCFIQKSLGANVPLRRINNNPNQEHEYETAVEARPPYVEPRQEDYYNVRGGATATLGNPMPSPTAHRRPPPMTTRNTMPALLPPNAFRSELNNALGKKS